MHMIRVDCGGADLALISSAVARLCPFDNEVPFCLVAGKILMIHADVIILLEHERADRQRIIHRQLPPRYLRHKKKRHSYWTVLGGN